MAVVALLFCTCFCNAQNYGNVWQFGDHVGLDFNSCEPMLVTGVNDGFEGCASICDSTGQLLFYTNSDKVWNRFHALMSNGNINATGGTLSQVLIIPAPLSDSIYYIITTKVQAQGTLDLEYHVVDMSLSAGTGNVSSAHNILSALNVTEQICATNHGNGIDIWLMTHEYGSSNFLAFLVTSTGISLTPVITSVGPTHVACTSSFNARGEIKFSPDGSKMAFNGNGVGGNNPSNILCLLDFDNLTGVVSNPVNLPFSRGEFGVSFSPDNSKLYGSTWKAFNFTPGDFNYLYQFDLSSGNQTTIINSKVILDSVAAMTASFGTIKIGPDGKVYCRLTGSSYLAVINSPNQPGLGCGYIRNGFYIGNQTWQYGLNNYIEYTTYCTSTSVHPQGNLSCSISTEPNPNNGDFNLVISGSSARLGITNVIIYNVAGQIVFSEQVSAGMPIPVSLEVSGIYLVAVVTNDGQQSTKRVIVNR